jgi:nucleotide-binding universal stress UspA family protein
MDTNNYADRVVVGVDGSPESVAALRYGARISHALGVPLEAVITWEYPRYLYLERDMDSQKDEVAPALLRTAIHSAFGDAPPERLMETILKGPAARTLIELSHGCGMLVLGTRGHGGFQGLLLGSVSRVCVEHAHCPVLVVRPDSPENDTEEQ